MRYAFHQAAVAHEDVGVVIDDVQTVFIKFGGKDFFRQCHTHSVGNALSQRAGGGFHAVGVAVFGVAGGFAVQLAEVFQVFNAQVVAGQVQQAVQQHGRVAVGEDEAVAVVEFGVGRVVTQEFRPQYFRHFRHTHGRAGVAGICFLNGIGREETDCVCQLRHFVPSLLYWFETVTVKKIPLIIARFGQAFKDMGGFQTTFPSIRRTTSNRYGIGFALSCFKNCPHKGSSETGKADEINCYSVLKQ